jgi:hypothetical protein
MLKMLEKYQGFYQNQLPILTKFPIANLNCNCKNYEFNKFTLVLVHANEVVKITKQLEIFNFCNLFNNIRHSVIH